MIPITRKEASIIDYLRKYGSQLPYAAQLARALKIPKVTVYRNLDSLEAKGVVENIQKGRMKFYKLTDKWKRIVEAAEVPSMTFTEEKVPSITREKIVPLKRDRRIWIAMSTPFEVNFFYTLIRKLKGRFDFLITARNHDRIFSMLEAMGLDYVPVGGAERDGRLQAYAETVQQLIPVIKKEKPDLLLTARWPEAVRVAFGFDIPAWTLYYDEREYHVNRMVFPLSSKVFTPRFYSVAELRNSGVNPDTIVWFRGFHTCYLKGQKIDGRNPFVEMGYTPPIVLVRPEPEFAAFFGRKKSILEETVSLLSRDERVKDELSIVVFPRTESQNSAYRNYRVALINDALVENPVLYADVTLGAAETMLMESFVLGKPAVSTIYWAESKPVGELHKHIPHILNPRLAADKIIHFTDFHERQRFQKKAEVVVSEMENPIEIIENEIIRLYSEPSSVEYVPKRRSGTEIYMSILRAVAFRPLKLKYVIQAVNLSYSRTRKNLRELKKQGLISEQKDKAGNKYYQATNEGIQALQAYETLK